MPPKRSPRSGAVPAARRGAASTASLAESPETYDVASLPMDDAAATPQPSLSLTSSQKRPRKDSASNSQPLPTAATAAAPSVTVEGVEETASPSERTIGTTAGSSLAEATLQMLVDGSSSAAAAADAILSVYRAGDTTAALCAVLNVLAKASGVAEVELDANALVDGVEIRPLLEELYARVPADSEAYLLVNKEARYRRFRRNFPEWCASLVRDAFAADVLLDAIFLPVLSQWVLAMSESKSRAFRHTATVVVLAFVQALSAIAADLQHQLSLVRAKSEISVVQRRRDDVGEWRDHLFSQAVHQRLRDVAPEIRLAAFQALRRWILDYPDAFMTNKYLRYLGMPLHDKRPELRAEALDTILQALARVTDAYSRTQLFLQYFTNRLVEMSGDVDVRCAELAVRVVAMIVRGDSDVPEGSELLTNAKIDQVLLTLFDERPTVRTAAGVLLKVFIHCRTAGEESEEAQVALGTELLCSFATTLRAQYHEAMPERYLIDALWTADQPPLLLTAYEPILATAQSEKALDAVVGLQLTAALLLKMQGRLSLGPLPKDDRRGGAGPRKISQQVKEETDVLRSRLSEDAAMALCNVLEVHRGNESVLQAAACVSSAVDMSGFTTQRHHTALSALLIELRKAALTSPCTQPDTRAALVQGWQQLAFTDHPLRTEAQAHLQELCKGVFSQVTRLTKRLHATGKSSTEEGIAAIWARLSVVSALVSTTLQWPHLYAALHTMLTVQPVADPSLAVLAVTSAFQSFLWQMKEQADKTKTEGGSDEVTKAVMQKPARDFVASVLQYATYMVEKLESPAPLSQFSSPAGNTPDLVSLVEVFVVACDVLALPYHDMPQTQQETLLGLLRTLHEQLSVELRMAQDLLHLHVQDHRGQQQQQQQDPSSSSVGLVAMVAARRACSRLEALQLRLVSGMARLFLLQRVDGTTLAPAFLSLWTQTPSKAVADTFKAFFHAVRERGGDDGFTLERDVVLSAYNFCATVGATPVSVEALSQIGAKLASLHFGSTDRFYTCCPAMVQFGAEFATSTDPLVLQAIVPYSVKVRPVDALHILRDQLSRNPMFAEASNPYVKTFVAALRKAAKLEDSSASGSSLLGSGISAGKRHRVLGDDTTLTDDEGMLAAITSELPGNARSSSAAASAATRLAARGQRLSVASRVVTADGWHVPAEGRSQEVIVEEDEVDVPASQGDARTARATSSSSSAAPVGNGRSIVYVPSAQDVAHSSTTDRLNNDEVFVATEEFE